MNLLILGSGPNAVTCQDWPRAPYDHILAINNAWRVRPDWDTVIYPEDFVPDRRPPQGTRPHIQADAFVPAQNAFGGFLYAGGTMAFTAAYWALHAMRPRVMAFLGCDMVYPAQGKTHFYGTGTPDPLRDDPTLQSLAAKSARLMVLAAQAGCACVSLSDQPSRLVFPRARPDQPEAARVSFDRKAAARAQAREAELGYMVASGRYWDEPDAFDAQELRKIDDMWLACLTE